MVEAGQLFHDLQVAQRLCDDGHWQLAQSQFEDVLDRVSADRPSALSDGEARRRAIITIVALRGLAEIAVWQDHDLDEAGRYDERLLTVWQDRDVAAMPVADRVFYGGDLVRAADRAMLRGDFGRAIELADTATALASNSVFLGAEPGHAFEVLAAGRWTLGHVATREDDDARAVVMYRAAVEAERQAWQHTAATERRYESTVLKYGTFLSDLLLAYRRAGQTPAQAEALDLVNTVTVLRGLSRDPATGLATLVWLVVAGSALLVRGAVDEFWFVYRQAQSAHKAEANNGNPFLAELEPAWTKWMQSLRNQRPVDATANWTAIEAGFRGRL